MVTSAIRTVAWLFKKKCEFGEPLDCFRIAAEEANDTTMLFGMAVDHEHSENEVFNTSRTLVLSWRHRSLRGPGQGIQHWLADVLVYSQPHQSTVGPFVSVK